MSILSMNSFLPNKNLISSFNPNSVAFQFDSKLFSFKSMSQNPAFSVPASLSTPTTTQSVITEKPESLSGWTEFANRVSGEWDGFCAEFTSSGTPIELPENVVPEAYREWEVQVHDWQTQCPTLASESNETEPTLKYKIIKLLPTVGCEADAATRYSVDEKFVGGENSGVLGFGYDRNGCYVSVSEVKEVLEVEHCLVDCRNKEVRVRVVMNLRKREGVMKLNGVRVFSEQWYGPWRNGESLGGCSIRESGFALSGRVEVANVVKSWNGKSIGVARFGINGKAAAMMHKIVLDVIRELREDLPQKSVRDEGLLIALPKNLWCSQKENENGETYTEVGWLLNSDFAITSRCVFNIDGTLKELSVGQETSALEELV